jgi:hypothetical protein
VGIAGKRRIDDRKSPPSTSLGRRPQNPYNARTFGVAQELES